MPKIKQKPDFIRDGRGGNSFAAKCAIMYQVYEVNFATPN